MAAPLPKELSIDLTFLSSPNPRIITVFPLPEGSNPSLGNLTLDVLAQGELRIVECAGGGIDLDKVLTVLNVCEDLGIFAEYLRGLQSRLNK
jgi:hypothetical protein